MKGNLTSTQPRAQALPVFIGTILNGNLCPSSMKFSAHNVTGTLCLSLAAASQQSAQSPFWHLQESGKMEQKGEGE